ncbi:hypothetical protein RO3G_01771 [Rhizopus delemar RA 99-880]|uniref:Uncharacterized protein n=1 Tax=Rhizopus delemar (strain RA 99-880 / ATCC MYA-4621 / FGSC 9543 / NRRL 43880) TaxID=246409 RepID=I1BLI7_RHIO9|nr:hypothetical protein RO3G_01771 [Rhizopus delemar RA 99-880]|eukprot:EIE77067.1 hypothetical protein RO3G_01771 [Rhizopus delemar RA 99-880]
MNNEYECGKRFMRVSYSLPKNFYAPVLVGSIPCNRLNLPPIGS